MEAEEDEERGEEGQGEVEDNDETNASSFFLLLSTSTEIKREEYTRMQTQLHQKQQ
jgi:hypothetical protein